MVMHSPLTRLLLRVLKEEAEALSALNAFLIERDEKPLTNLATSIGARITQLLEIWPEGRVGCDFAEHVLPVWEQAFPEDARPRAAIEAKRRWFARELSGEALDQAFEQAMRAANAWESSQPRRVIAAALAAANAAASPCNPAMVASDAQDACGDDAEIEAEWQRSRLIEVLSE